MLTDETRLTNIPAPVPAGIFLQSRRRGRESSPIQIEKVKRRRTVTVKAKNIIEPKQNTDQSKSVPNMTMADFEISELETRHIERLKVQTFLYNIMKSSAQTIPSDIDPYILTDFRQFLPENITLTEPSNIYYLEILDENPDSAEAMLQVAEDLLEKFDQQKYVVLVGDGKTYQHLTNIKHRYALDRLLIFPGDWHTLKNYQIVLMKIYYSAGLKELAANTGYRGQTLKSLETSGSFKRTHKFIVQSWEALYRRIIYSYCEYKDDDVLLEMIKEKLKMILTTHIDNPVMVMQEMESFLSVRNVHTSFNEFINRMSEKDDTWKLWTMFFVTVMHTSIGLYIAIRGSNWPWQVSK